MSAKLRVTWSGSNDDALGEVRSTGGVQHVMDNTHTGRLEQTLNHAHRQGLNKKAYCEALAEYALKLMREDRGNRSRVEAIQRRIEAIRGSDQPIELVSL